LRGADDEETSRAELVDNAGHQGDLRAHYSKVSVNRFGHVQIFRRSENGADLSYAGIAGRAKDLMSFKREAPGDCMLAAAAADHENFHDEVLV
jgi:hypothetical protein